MIRASVYKDKTLTELGKDKTLAEPGGAEYNLPPRIRERLNKNAYRRVADRRFPFKAWMRLKGP